MREHQMEIYRHEMERMEKRHEQCKDKQDCRHHELMMMLMMMVSGKDTNSLNYITNNPIASPFAAKKAVQKSLEAYLSQLMMTMEKNMTKAIMLKIKRNAKMKMMTVKTRVMNQQFYKSQGVLFYQEEGFKMSPKIQKKT
eukprot:4704773-Ditylum_brightwellii.AAC.1